MSERQIVLDTETTGLDPAQGHRIIEIGAVELVNRRLTGRRFHRYLQPDRPIDEGAVQVHGITNEFLADKPRFEEVVSNRQLHGALLDAEILAEVYLAMTGGQGDLGLATEDLSPMRAMLDGQLEIRRLDGDRPRLRVVRASEAEHAAHEARLDAIEATAGRCLWRALETE